MVELVVGGHYGFSFRDSAKLKQMMWKGGHRRFRRSFRRRSTRRAAARSNAVLKNYTVVKKGRSYAAPFYTTPGDQGNPFPKFYDQMFPAFKFAQLSWTDIERYPLSTTAGVSGAGAQWYRLNSYYDPWGGATVAINPEWYTTMSNIYARYIVYKVDVRIHAYDATNGSCKLYAILAPSGDTTNYGSKDPAFYESRRNCQAITFNNYGGGQAPTELDFTIDLWKMEGLSYRDYMGDLPDYSAAINANPSKICNLYIYACDPAGNASQGARINVTLRQHVKFFQRFGGAP